MHYVVYIPAATGYDARGLLAAAGIGGLYDTALGVDVSDCDAGPDGGRGVLLRWEDRLNAERNATGRIDDKTWWQDQPANRFWIGWHADAAPTPTDLQRNAALSDDPTLSSFPVALEDGRRWWVPIARDLPKRYVQDPDTGQQRLAPKTPFQQFWDDTIAMRERYTRGQLNRDMQIDGLFEYAVAALALNYRLTAEVVLALGLFDQSDPIKVLAAAIEISTRFKVTNVVEEYLSNPLIEKKKPA